ncbi:PucR family transcriptional regulator [Lentzea tibetensis]|uniref:PucR family transcriptional regulator n=1 Tax=Lentzea tibetensis TaxID=2591470 RepID=A0A563EY25_9PSEU|nr:helix-turn-helix domain-containing protein [Lentzea tibetensis]TWP52448.1 PucR family transcriptional regulator [Lentzea tibetensis]
MSLRQILIALGDPLVEVEVVPHGLETEVRDVVIMDPDDAPDVRPGDLVLVIGARGRAALPLIRAAGRAGAAAVAVKESTQLLEQAAIDAGVALLNVRPEVRWEHLEALARGVLTTATDDGEVLGDLFALAQTIATLTGGIVSIEDTASRVLAYSRSSDEVDELRRLSILGRQGPEPYLKMLREWGVYNLLRSGEEVVRIDERPELGIRKRIAVGIHAGNQPLGTIWVQEGDTPLAEQAERALLGAARVTALHLIQQRNQPTSRFRENLLVALLDGRMDAATVAGQIGADPAKPAAVVVFALRGEGGRTEIELRRSEMTGLISVHAAAYRRSALVSEAGGRTYVLLPDLAGGAQVLSLTREIVTTARRHLGIAVRAAVGSTVSTLDDARTSRQEADRVLDAMSRDLETDVATLADVRSQVLVSETLALLAEHPRIRDPRIDALDAELAKSLLAWLDALGDVRAAAERLHVHPNTLRYRLKRVDLDLDDPLVRLFAQLQLRMR